MCQHLYESESWHVHYLVPAITLSELPQDSVPFSIFPFPLLLDFCPKVPGLF